MNNQADSNSWAPAGGAHQRAMVPSNDDDFTSFLDFENMDLLEFPTFGGTGMTEQQQQQQQQQHHQQQQQQVPEDYAHDAPMQGADSSVRQWAMSAKFQQQQRQQQFDSQDPQYHMRRGIPPTPTSTELFPSQQMPNTRGQLPDGRYTGRLDDLNMFTPSMTPTVGGSESAFSAVHEYAMPGAYMNGLSPLTSPAMRPQNQSAQYHASTAASSLAASPVDLSFDSPTDPTPNAERPRKTRKKTNGGNPSNNNTTTAALRSRTVTRASSTKRRLSPVGKSSTDNNSQVATEDGQDAVRNQSSSINPGMTMSQRHTNGSLSKSISPQPLTEASMAPPPKPQASQGDSAEAARNTSGESRGKGVPPATPASLMRLQTKQRQAGEFSPSTASLASPNTGGIESSMGFLALPESAAPLDLGQTGSSSTSTPISAGPSQPTNPLASPSGILAKGHSKSSNSRKRGSQSHLVSPALRPKISPSIKPLLPEGAHSNLSNDAHALLLASKSNYQNLLEGNQVPGVHYPAHLASNLTSKRTSHKIAEQGRRNRINTALQEMQALLPPAMSRAAAKDAPVDGTSGNSPDLDEESPAASNKHASKSASAASGKGDSKAPSPSQGGNSKAATVELAIQYIKDLTGQLSEQSDENTKLKAELAQLKRASDGGHGCEEVGGSQDRDATPTPSPAASQGAIAAEREMPTNTKSPINGSVGGAEDAPTSSSSSSSNDGSADSAMADV